MGAHFCIKRLYKRILLHVILFTGWGLARSLSQTKNIVQSTLVPLVDFSFQPVIVVIFPKSLHEFVSKQNIAKAFLVVPQANFNEQGSKVVMSETGQLV